MAWGTITRSSVRGLQLLLVLLGAASACAQPAADAPGKTVAVNGIEMYYETSGEGEPLLLLHGFGGSGLKPGRSSFRTLRSAIR
jgi:hypothetical protein